MKKKSIVRKTLVIASVLFGATLVFAESVSPVCDDIDPYVYTDYRAAFDQTAVWKKHRTALQQEGLIYLVNPEVKGDRGGSSIVPATKALNHALIADFLAKKKNYAYLPFAKRAKSMAFYLATFASILCAASVLLPEKIVNHGIGFTGFFVTQQIARTIFEGFNQYFKLRNYKGDPLLEYEIKYATQKRFLNPKLWESIEGRFLAARNNAYTRQSHITFFENIFNLPRLFHEANFFAEAKDKSVFLGEFSGNFDRSFAGVYNDPTCQIEQIAAAFWTHLSASKPVENSKGPLPSPPSQRRPIFLLGRAGMGKTTMIEHLAKGLDFPLIRINLAEAIIPEDLVGSKERPGILLEKINSSPYKNAILFFDEASEAFNDTAMKVILKGIFEPDRGRFLSPFLGMEVDLRHYLVVIAGNLPIIDEAVASRFVIVNYPEFNQSYIKSYATDIMIPAQLAIGTHITTLESLSEVEREELNNAIVRCKNPRELGHFLPIFFGSLEIQRSKKLL